MNVMNQKGFNEWAKQYDQSVEDSNKNNSYPFAGYDKLMTFITQSIEPNSTVLDLGVGTGVLAGKLIEKGCTVTGVDFSEEMLKLAKENNPTLIPYLHDLNSGFPQLENPYDFIISTYAIHHFDFNVKINIIKEAMNNLKPGQKMLIGDVSFETKDLFEECRKEFLNIWDDEEDYYIFDEMKHSLKEYNPQYIKVSFCAGILVLTKK